MYHEIAAGLVIYLAVMIALPSATQGTDVDFAVQTCKEVHCNRELRTWLWPVKSTKMCFRGCVAYVYCTAILLSDDAAVTACLGSDSSLPFAFLDSPTTFGCLKKCLTPKRAALMGYPKVSNDMTVTPREYFGKVFDDDLENVLG